MSQINTQIIRSHTIQAKYSCQSPFVVVLFCSYWQDFNKLLKIHYNSEFAKGEFMSYIQVDLTFYSLSVEFIVEIQNFISHLAKLMPFVPRSVIVYNKSPPAILEIFSVAGDYFTNQYPLKNDAATNLSMDELSLLTPFAYHCNRKTINFLSERIDDLVSPNPIYRFSFTSESFIQTLDEDDKTSDIGWLIQYEKELNSVFTPKGNHLIILSSPGHFIPDEEPIPFTNEYRKDGNELNELNVITAAPRVLPNIISVRYIQNAFLVKKIGSYLKICSGKINKSVKILNDDIHYGNIQLILNQFRVALFNNEKLSEDILLKSLTSSCSSEELNMKQISNIIKNNIKSLQFKDIIINF
jgi:hypothetical protein